MPTTRCRKRSRAWSSSQLSMVPWNTAGLMPQSASMGRSVPLTAVARASGGSGVAAAAHTPSDQADFAIAGQRRQGRQAHVVPRDQDIETASAAPALEKGIVHAPAIEKNQQAVAGGSMGKYGFHNSVRIGSRSSARRAAVREKRRREVPLGTVGGRMAKTI